MDAPEKNFTQEFLNLQKSINERKLEDFDSSVKNIIFSDGDLKYMGTSINVANYENMIKYVKEDIYYFRFFKITGKTHIGGFLLYLSIVSSFDEDLVFEVYKILRTEYELLDITTFIDKNRHLLLIDADFYLDYLGDLEKDFQPGFNKEDYLKTVGMAGSLDVFADKPEWVTIFPTETVLSLKNDIIKKLILKDEDLKLVEKFVDDTFDFDKKKIDLFRMYGPSNRIGEDDEDRECLDCRMLSCDCLMEDETDFENWFGRCEICLNKIKDISWALRAPHKNGGWYGCYCCFDCLKKDIEEDNIDNFEKVRSQILTFGIMDRSLS